MKTKSAISTLILIGLLLFLFFSCKKEPVKVAPTVTISSATNITATTATSGGVITSDGGAAVTSRGVCWRTLPNPTITDSKTVDGMGSGSFASLITGLTPDETYYFSAYATNSIGTSYGTQITVTTLVALPAVTTTAYSAITATTAKVGGKIMNDTRNLVTIKGVCWNTSQNPTTSNNKTIGSDDGKGDGSFTSILTDLESNTTYYLRAYATNSAGTGYGSEITLRTPVYQTVTIGAQVWMVENLKATKYRNGDIIPSTVFTSVPVSFTNIPGFQWTNGGGNSSNQDRLYNWFAITDSRGICPTGWHIPSDAEWTTLTTYLGGLTVAGGKLKITTLWQSPNVGATNESGFKAYPFGGRVRFGDSYSFYGSGIVGYWWSSTESNADYAWYRSLHYQNGGVSRDAVDKMHGFSVRCIKN